MSNIPTKEQYEANELARFNQELKGGESNTADMLDMCKNFKFMLYDRVRWILDGNYGAGALLAYNRLTKRMNRKAWLFVTIARLEFNVSNRAARKLWSLLTNDDQISINTSLAAIIDRHDNGE